MPASWMAPGVAECMKWNSTPKASSKDVEVAEVGAAGAKALDVKPTFLEHGIAVPNAALLARAVAPLLGG